VAPPLPPAPTATAAVATPRANLGSKIDALFARYTAPDAPGCAVGVYRAGEVVFERGYGAASLEHGVPIDGETVFNVGSIAKQFTAAALLLLVADGKVSLDDDVRKYVPELPDFGHPVRLRHLLHHTGGLRDIYALLPLEGFMPADYADDDDALYALAHQKHPLAPPGTAWRYSNTGYFLVALVVKRVSGMPFSELVKKRIFDPLGMKSTVVVDDYRRVVPRRATGYAPRRAGAYRVEIASSQIAGATLLFTSIDDLARWDANFYAKAVGGAPMLDAMRTPGTLDDGKPFPIAYGMGLDERPAGALPQEEHTGEDMGFVADLVRYPTQRLTVACLCNDDTADAIVLAHAVAQVMLPDLAKDIAASPSGPKGDDAASGATMDAATLEGAMGAYYDPHTFDIRTLSKGEGGRVVLTFGIRAGSPKRELAPSGARMLVGKDDPTRYVVDPAQRSLTVLVENGDPQTLVRFEPPTLAAGSLAPYVGRFASDELRGDLRVSVVDGSLQLGPWGRARGSTGLDAIGKDVFAGSGGLPSAVKVAFARDLKGHVRGFDLTTDDMTFAFRRRGE
jgi:CubicO group peptidase (beta-lactamase class C family)